MMPNSNGHHSSRKCRARLSALLAALALTATALAQPARMPQKTSAPLDVENARIVHLEHLWLQAQNSGNAAELDNILAGDFVRPSPADGQFITKTDIMKYLETHPFPRRKGPKADFAQLRVTIYGNVAIARGILTATDAHRVLVRKILFTDVFVRRQSRWQAVSAQENEVPLHP
jgi:ketosteroid isomerase-like protein